MKTGIRSTKGKGYNTCPFDEMITNYPGLIECIKDGFDELYDTRYLQVKQMPATRWLSAGGQGDKIVHHTKYNFLFNHESPGHANLYTKQNWAGGINHYVDNNFEKFVERYQRRVNNIKAYLSSGDEISFILTRYNTHEDDLMELKDVLKIQYPDLKYTVNCLDCDKITMRDHMMLMGVEESHQEVLRLS